MASLKTNKKMGGHIQGPYDYLDERFVSSCSANDPTPFPAGVGVELGLEDKRHPATCSGAGGGEITPKLHSVVRKGARC